MLLMFMGLHNLWQTPSLKILAKEVYLAHLRLVGGGAHLVESLLMVATSTLLLVVGYRLTVARNLRSGV